MTKYMYNPSQKVTEILSKFLEFDPEQLELGIWSGDLSLNNVKLRPEALEPILNKKANKFVANPLKKAPLHMRLVSGTIGHMRIKIPWKKLVWGQDAVHVEISDIQIVLEFQSREETERQKNAENAKMKKKKKKKDKSTEESLYERSYRQAKQRRLREAERRQLQGMAVALYLANVHRKNSIEKEATKAAQESQKHSSKRSKEPSRVDRWLKNTTSDFFWRFYTGLQGSIKKARIVVVQDGVEVGVIFQSIEVLAGKDGTKVTLNSTHEDSETADDDVLTGRGSGMSPPDQFVYESEFDDGEHVDKTFKQQGLGIFVRKEKNMAKVPQTLRFSSSVSADDYILRPVDLDLSFSFFYPYPPERRKKKSIDSPSLETPSTAASTNGEASSLADISTASTTKRRRGKRERMSPSTSSIPTTTTTTLEERRGMLKRSGSSPSLLSPSKDRIAEMTSKNYIRSHRRMADELSRSIHNTQGHPKLSRKTSVRSLKSAGVFSAGMSILDQTIQTNSDGDSAAVLKRTILSPRFDCKFHFEEIRFVFSTRHYELLNYFVSTVLRMRNGRPDQQIRLVRKTAHSSTFHRDILKDHDLSPRSPKKKKLAPAGGATSKIGALLAAPLSVFRSADDGIEPVDDNSDNSADEDETRVHLSSGGIHSARSEVTISWWRYAIGAILWEVRKRKHLTENFNEMYISFDWKKQRHRRQEYIDIYVAIKLEKRRNDTVWPFEDIAAKEEVLQKIEDELSIEQILLYRSIARSMRVKGVKKMTELLVNLHPSHASKALAIKNSLLQRKGTSSSIDKATSRSGGSSHLVAPGSGDVTLLSLIQNKFDVANRLRVEGDITWIRNKRSSNQKRGENMSSDDDSDNLSTQNFQNHQHTRARRRSSMGYDSVDTGEGGRGRRKSFDGVSTGGKQKRKPSIGYDSGSEKELRAGSLYQSGASRRENSVADARTLMTKTKGHRESRHTRQNQGTVGSAGAGAVDTDNRMRFSVIFRVKCIDIMIIQEDYLFDVTPLEKTSQRSIGALSNNKNFQEEYDSSESSSSDVSDLSVLTDDQRFFEGGHAGPVAEEEKEEEGGAKLSSTDFLLFGLPENTLLRLTISNLGSSLKGKSGGPVEVKLVVGHIAAKGEEDSHILSMGPDNKSLSPVAEVNVQSGMGRRPSNDSLFMDLGKEDDKSVDFSISRRSKGKSAHLPPPRTRTPARAVSLVFSGDGVFKCVHCDLSKIAMTVDLNPAAKLLHFYSKSEIKYPHKILEKSSREVARKFMVYKTSNSSGFGDISTALRVHGLEVRLPYSYQKGDGNTSEASELDWTDNNSSGFAMGDSARSTTKDNCSVLVSAGTMELYGGQAVEEISAGQDAPDFGKSRSSLLSGISYASKATVKSLEMIDLAQLTANHDSFAANNWVAILGGIECILDSRSPEKPQLTEVPIDIEVLLTVSRLSLLETENPKHEAVVEISPVHVVLSERRLNLLRAAKTSVDFDVLDTTNRIRQLKRRKPDPPRIEILSRRILHSIDLSCKKVDVAMLKDERQDHFLSLKYKEIVMEESLSDFLSVVSCFDFSLPNEEALSSAMQVCIGRLVGLGLTDDEAWGCTNAARLNFLDDIALMRRAQTDVLVQLSASMHGSNLFKTPLHEDSDEDNSSSSGALSFNDDNPSQEGGGALSGAESVATGTTGEDNVSVVDDDSANSADIVETTFKNAVEKTVATFSPLLQQEYCGEGSNQKTILAFNLPYGLRLSLVKLFYDQYLTFFVTSVVVTNSAGIELVTLVPNNGDATSGVSLDEDEEEATASQGISFSRFDLDKGYGFGSGGLGMSVLANDEGADTDTHFRERARFDDVEIGEIEILFASNIVEAIIDDVSDLNSGGPSPTGGSVGSESHHTSQPSRPPVESSTAIVACTVSALFTTDELVPFCRLTLETISYKNKKALESISTSEVPSWALLAESLLLQNLSPEGQFYPTVLAALENGETVGFPFQVRYFKSPNPWQFSSRLQIEFVGFRLYLYRQFIHEILQFFVYDRDGIGRLKKKYSKDIRDMHGNQRPPLLWSVKVIESSVICPRNSTCSDMAAFEVKEAGIAVSYIPGTFKMPTRSSHFESIPKTDNPNASRFTQHTSNFRSRRDSLASVSNYQDCFEKEGNDLVNGKSGEPISAYTKEFKKRLTIELNQFRVFSSIAENKEARDIIESPIFRFFHTPDGRADHGKAVYARETSAERQPAVDPDSLLQIGKYKQYWEEISTNLLDLTVLVDYAPHMRLLISSNDTPLSLDPRMSQLILLLTVWDSNMQELPNMFPFPRTQVSESATPPTIPADFPKYGTEECISFLEDTSSIRSEICCMFKDVSLRCTYDPPGFFPIDPGCFPYFEDPRCPDDEKPGTVLALADGVVHVVNDFLNVKRIAIGASKIHITDERREDWGQDVLVTSPPEPSGSQPPAWADLSWGLREDVRTLSSSLPLPVQFSVFMIPAKPGTSGWSLINVGAQSLNGTMFELSWVWCFLDYFKSYFTMPEFGNPGHQAQFWTHQIKNAIRKANGEDPVVFEPLPGVNVDFRLWLCRPILCVPSDYGSSEAPCLRIDSKTGLWYQFQKIQDLSAQRVVSTNLNLHFANDYQPPDVLRYRDQSLESVSGVRSLVEGLSFGLRYDCNNLCNHKDVCVRIPFAGDKLPSLSVAGSELEVPPVKLSDPIVCRPFKLPDRSVGPTVCGITCIIEVLPITAATMMNFFKGPAEINQEFAPEEEDQGPPGFSVAANISDLRIFAIDPVLGVQLPVAVVSLSSVSLTATKFAVERTDASVLQPGESPPEDLQVTCKCHLWADYFKLGLTRSWEPLLEPFDFLLLYEQSRERGQGLTLDTDAPFHVNLSGALLQILGDTIQSFSSLIGEAFGDQAQSTQALRRSVKQCSPSKRSVGVMVEDLVQTLDGRQVDLLHEIPKTIKLGDRVAFSLRNLTGQKIRVHQQADNSTESAATKPAVVTYLSQSESMGLTFAATISVVKNLSIVEVPYPGLPYSQGDSEYQGSLNHAVDLQAPGFRWIKDIKVDTFGRKFETLIPRSHVVLSKILRDWRLENAMMLLTEVGLDSGGRSVTVRSLFEIRNSTTHPIKIVYNPDPRYKPLESIASGESLHPIAELDAVYDEYNASSEDSHDPRDLEIIEPGEVLQLPTLLLERSLQMEGSHLGCFWVCPETRDESLSLWEYFRSGGTPSNEEDTFSASFCSRPIQLARLVQESSVIFQQKAGQDIPADDAKTGIQVSCPTRTRSGDGRAPFCYAIEVGRSPLVSSNRETRALDSRDVAQVESEKQEKKAVLEMKSAGSDKKSKKAEEKLHGPVAYSLSIHAPIVVVNLLPEGGRFELMHAIRRTVLWYADLQPGQQVPVHSVGLDAPLLLLVNLGFCRTPVGEGALVHHGVQTVSAGKEQGVGLKSIGKAVKKGTKQIGKTMTAMSESPDKRGQGRLGQVTAPQFHNRENRKEKRKQPHVSIEGSLGLDADGDIGAVGGKVHSVDSQTYAASDVASETTVVDGVGQRLILNIENVQGGGGQRRVSLFCPFWIVNTTEHALRYKQDKGNSFVSGTVINPDKDGSRPVDGSNRNYRNRHKRQYAQRGCGQRWKQERTPMNSKTIFAGTPGALATSPGRCGLPPPTLAELIDKEPPLEKLADLAFMFNFHEEGLSIGNQTLVTQLYDGTEQSHYTSEWSRGFSLDSVGFSQIVGMQCKEGRCLELSVEVNVAPGFLSAYTKIVRFLPRYVVYNRLERPVRLWQDSSVFRSANEDRGAENTFGAKESRKWRYASEDKHCQDKINQYESLLGRPATIDDNFYLGAIPVGTTAHPSALYINSVGPSELVPFALPDSRKERQLRLDPGGNWNVTASFASDMPGEHVLRMTPATDMRLLNHVSTRAAPKFKLVLPPPDDAGLGKWDGELGVFFETDWGGDRRIIVKGTKRGKYAHNHTDVHVGDELIRVDGVSVVQMSFGETMKLIKERLAFVAAAHNKERKADDQTKSSRRFPKGFSMSRRQQQGSGYSKQTGPEGSGSTSTQLTLTFRTLEERLRKVRQKAARSETASGVNSHVGAQPTMEKSPSVRSLDPKSEDNISVELKSLHNTMFLVLRNQDNENPPFRIQNRSLKHIVFYRQRGCEGHPWNQLMPGESMPYSWEEPMKSKKLTVRIASTTQDFVKADGHVASSLNDNISESDFSELKDGTGTAPPDQEKRSARAARVRQVLSYQFVDTEERGGFGQSITVRLEEIGFRNLLPLPDKANGKRPSKRRGKKYLTCEVDTDGGTRLLVVSDDSGAEDERDMLNEHLDTLQQQINYEQERVAGLHSFRSHVKAEEAKQSIPKSKSGARNKGNSDAAQVIGMIENEARQMMEDFPEESTMTSRHQVVIEVMEAVGLNASDFVGSCNPYCEVFLKGRSKSRKHFFQKRVNKRKTYFIEKCLNPKWTDQVFVFNVPEDAVRITRGHELQVKVRNFRMVGQHPILGSASVHFGSLRNQQELVGWYPLAGRTGRRETDVSPFSDFTRGSIKLRVRWVYTTSALIDYFLFLSQERLIQLQQSRKGMTEQLAHAIESDQRKHSSRDQLQSGRIKKLVKLEQKSQAVRQGSSGRKGKQKKSGGSLNQGLNTSLTVLQDTLKSSRDRYLYALYFQTVESKRNRQMEQDEREKLTSGDDMSGSKLNLSELPMISEHKSPGSLAGSIASSKKSLETFLSQQRSMQSPLGANSQKPKTLDDFFAQQKEDTAAGNSKLAIEDAQAGKIETPRRISRRLLDSDAGRRMVSHRKLSLDVEEIDDDTGDNPAHQLLRQGQAVYDGFFGQAPDIGISDLMSVSTDIDEEAKRRKNISILKQMGFVFHDDGEYFHEDHLPLQFRRSLFASSMTKKRSARLYRAKWAVGTSSAIRHFKSAQSAGALHFDPQTEVTLDDDAFLVRLKCTLPTREPPEMANVTESKGAIMKRLMVPNGAPAHTVKRAKERIESMSISRTSFERMCRRNLGAALNPGGWLTIRPITVLNLPDTYNGMFVKLRYGSEVLVSETVDAKVTPRWAFPEISPASKSRMSYKRSSSHSRTENHEKFRFSENDLHVHVEPQQTSGLIKISVVAERLNNKTELGVLQIPLGAAIAACIDSTEASLGSTSSETLPTPMMYVRWFPLMSPRLAVPVEGDMGLSSRPKESEQLRDNMFQQYFAPCIQLALIWWPDDNVEAERASEDGKSEEANGPLALHGPTSSAEQPNDNPVIQTYFNADISRISAALLDSQRALELLSFSFLDIDVRYSVTKSKTRIGLVVGWIQLDHQDTRAREPVVLAPTPMEHVQPTLQILALKDNVRTKSNIMSYEYIGVALQEMDLTVEESWIFELWDFFMGIMKRRRVKKNTAKGERRADLLSTNENCFTATDMDDASPPSSLLSILRGEGASASTKRKIYIEQLILGLVKVNLSYVKGKNKGQPWELSDEGAKAIKNLEVKELPNLALAAGGIQRGNFARTDQSEVFAKWSQDTFDEDYIDGNAGYNLPGIIAAVFPSVSDAPIRLQGKAIDHVFESPGEILSSIKNFYVNETLKQVYKIIGSLDFVGNPTIIFSSFVAGVRDLVVAPTTAFLKSPTNVNQVGIGVAKGTISLFSHSASGIFGFAAKMSAAAGQAAAIASLDPEYRQWHRDRVVTEATNLNRVWKRRGVLSVSEMITRPVGDILMGVAMGASGFFISPYKGALKGGTLGFVRGVATGTAGVVAKPLVGFFDAFTHFSATAHDIAKSVNVLERRYQPALKLRLPYTFGPMNILVPFDPVTARSVYLLRMFPTKSKRGQRRGDRSREIHVHSEVLHMEPGVETYAIATTIRVVLIKVKKYSGGVLTPSFAWEVDLSGGAVVSSQVSDHGHNGVALTITKRADDRKTETAQRESKNIPLRRESVINRIPFSQLSNASSRSDNSASDELNDDVEYENNLESVDNLQPADPYDDAELQDTYNDHGATKAEGKVLEWYTVLAEFQHRRQLTSLHNSISCIVGNTDAIVVDEVRAFEYGSQEGVTTFGIFNFERDLQDSETVAASNSALVAALDVLPWMHEREFKAVQGLPKDERREFVSGVRSNWTFMRDLEASLEQGGPNWLVEARARAMFVSNAQLVSERHGTSDVATDYTPERFVSYARSDASDILSSSHRIDTSFSSDNNRIDTSYLGVGVPRNSGQEENHVFDIADPHEIPGLDPDVQVNIPSGVGVKSSALESIDANAYLGNGEDDSSFESNSLPFEDAVSYTNASTSVAAAGDNTCIVRQSAEEIVVSQDDSRGVPKLSVSTVPEGARGGIVAVSTNSSSRPEGSRIDRMENLMEQLVILNATQVQKQHAVPTEIFSATHSDAGDFGIAGVIKNELAELRTQVQARSKEDDALRDEIAALRKQLAERRSARQPGETTTRIGHRFSDVFRFGKNEHVEEERAAGEKPGKEPSLLVTIDTPHQIEAIKSEPTSEENMGLVSGDHKSSQRRSVRRNSGNSATSVSARSPRRNSGTSLRLPGFNPPTPHRSSTGDNNG